MIKLQGRLLCATLQQAETVRRLLPEHVQLTQAEVGCLAFKVTETADPLVWQVEELFTDKQTFAAHQARTRSSTWGIETSAIAREYEITEVVA